MAVFAAENARATGQPGATEEHVGPDVERLNIRQEGANRVGNVRMHSPPSSADLRHRKQSQPSKDEYQRLLIENLVAANQEATRNFQTLLKTIGPADENSSIMTASTREMSIGESTLVAQEEPSDLEQTRFVVTEQASSKYPRAPDTGVTERSRDLDGSDGIGIGESAISSTNSATETTRACLKRIQQALDQFEASEENLKSAGQIAVSIEVYKHILDSDIEAKRQKPWEVAQIRRQYDTALEAAQAGELLEPGDRKSKPVVQVGAGQGVSNENFSDKTKAMLGISSRPVELHPSSKRMGIEAGVEEPYDAHVPSVGSHGDFGRMSGNERTSALQAQVDKTVSVMRNSINKVSERGERLDSSRAGGNRQSEADLLLVRRSDNQIGLVDGRNGTENSYDHSPAVKSADKRTAEHQKQLDETLFILHQNIDKVLHKGESDSLQDRTESPSGSHEDSQMGSDYRVRKQPGLFSGLNKAWNSLPSAKAVAASTDKFFQE